MRIDTLNEYVVSPLFHSIRKAGISNLLTTNKLMTPRDLGDATFDGYTVAVTDSRNPDSISFSRNFNHPFYSHEDVIIFTLDRNKLRHNFKLSAHSGDWLVVTTNPDKHKEPFNYHEAEERAIKSIPNLNKYLINIMLPRQMYAAYHRDFDTNWRTEQKIAFGMNDEDLNKEQERFNPWIKPLKSYSEKYHIPVIPKKGQSLPRKEMGLTRTESVYENMLEEDQVLSSWIADLEFDDSQDSILMTLLNGRNYTVYDVDEDLYQSWMGAPSKGKFWHEYIRDFHSVI